MNQTALILDFGGQYKDLIARRVRELNVHSIIRPNTISLQEIKKINPLGIILTGGPKSVYRPDAPQCDKDLFSLGYPILGICYGMQLMCYDMGGCVSPCAKSEYGTVKINLNTDCPLFDGINPQQTVLMSHTDQVTRMPYSFTNAAYTDNCKIAAMADINNKLYAVQFHPEAENTTDGIKILENFLYKI